jgi:hypothetical protein
MTQCAWGLAAAPDFQPRDYWSWKDRSSEVEIARITVGVVLPDVVSIRARRAGRRIIYRIVDDYQGFPPYRFTPNSTARPLRFAELQSLIGSAHREGSAGAGIATQLLDWHSGSGADLISLANSVRGESRFYPGLAGHLARLAREWASARCPVRCQR